MGGESQTFDTDYDFFAEYRKPVDKARYHTSAVEKWLPEWELLFDDGNTHIKVKLLQLDHIERFMRVFEDAYDQSRIPEESRIFEEVPPDASKPTVFKSLAV